MKGTGGTLPLAASSDGALDAATATLLLDVRRPKTVER